MAAKKDNAHGMASQSIPAEQAALVSLRREVACDTLSNASLATRCLRELGNDQQGEPCDDTFGLELLRRATLQGDPEALEWVQDCFRESVCGWLCHHPSREVACCLESEETYVTLTFERFWQATTLTQQVEFRTLATALHYLRASLHGAILDTLRAYARPKDDSLPEPSEQGEPNGKVQADSSKVWESLQSMLPKRREQRLVYLLYQGGLGPKEIVHFYSQEWGDVQEIYRLRHNILERVLRNMDQLHWRLTLVEEEQ